MSRKRRFEVWKLGLGAMCVAWCLGAGGTAVAAEEVFCENGVGSSSVANAVTVEEKEAQEFEQVREDGVTDENGFPVVEINEPMVEEIDIVGNANKIDALQAEEETTYRPYETATYTYKYKIDEQGVVITGLVPDEGKRVDTAGELVIPQAIDGVQVYKIGSDVFYNCDKLTGSIVIPEGVKEIGKRAFYDCDGLEGDLVIGEGVEIIDEFAFAYCGNLKGKLYLPESLTTIEDYAFASCVNLTGEAKLPANLEKIGEKGLCWCGGLGNKLVFGDKLQILGNEAICPVTSGRFIVKTRVYFAGSISEIGDYAFGCVDRVTTKDTGNYVGIALPVYVYAPKGSEVDVYLSTHDKIKLGSNIYYVGLDKNFPFQDVELDSWKYEGIEYVYQRNLMSGVSETLFQPDATLSRSQFVTVLYNDTYEPAVTFETPFEDVAEGMWYSTPVVWATDYGIVSGYPEYIFGVEDDITREQFVVMLYQFAQLAGKVKAAPTGDLLRYEDVASVQSWAKEAMLWAVQNELVTGKPTEDGGLMLDPQGNATRAECAAIMMMFDKNF